MKKIPIYHYITEEQFIKWARRNTGLDLKEIYTEIQTDVLWGDGLGEIFTLDDEPENTLQKWMQRFMKEYEIDNIQLFYNMGEHV